VNLLVTPGRSWHAKLGQNDIASDSSMASEIANVLVATLSADPNTRIAAELRINELFRTPGSLRSICHLLPHNIYQFLLLFRFLDVHEHAIFRPTLSFILRHT
jgi:hypothetical protein